MAQQGAALQNYNNELVKCIEELCSKRDDINKQILREEEEKVKLQNDIRILTEKLSRVNESLARKLAARNDFDRTIAETEAAYMKILESSQTLLNVLKREAGTLGKSTDLTVCQRGPFSPQRLISTRMDCTKGASPPQETAAGPPGD